MNEWASVESYLYKICKVQVSFAFWIIIMIIMILLLLSSCSSQIWRGGNRAIWVGTYPQQHPQYPGPLPDAAAVVMSNFGPYPSTV